MLLGEEEGRAGLTSAIDVNAGAAPESTLVEVMNESTPQSRQKES